MYAEKKDLKRRMDFKNSASCDLISRNFEEEQAVRHSGRDFREPSSTASVGIRFPTRQLYLKDTWTGQNMFSLDTSFARYRSGPSLLRLAGSDLHCRKAAFSRDNSPFKKRFSTEKYG
jgi:hypothetical protein